MRAGIVTCICFASSACFFGGRRHEEEQPDAAVVPRPDAGVAPDGQCRGYIFDAGMTFSLTGRVMQFETSGEPVASAAVELHTAWDVEGAFPVGCAPLAQALVGSADGFVARFPDVKAPLAFVVAMYVDGDGQVHSINDKRLPCYDGCAIGSEASPYPMWVLSRATYEAWKPSIPVDHSRSGLVVVTFRDRDGKPVAGVKVQGARLLEKLHDLVPGREVFFLGADRRTLETRNDTGTSGTAVIPLGNGVQMDIAGVATGITFEVGVTVAAPAGSVFFEQIDPR